jgi:hypothetical protein
MMGDCDCDGETGKRGKLEKLGTAITQRFLGTRANGVLVSTEQA